MEEIYTPTVLPIYTRYENLANAIILQAVTDYRTTDDPLEKADIKDFFLTDWYSNLTKLDGQFLLDQLDTEARTDGCKVHQIIRRN